MNTYTSTRKIRYFRPAPRCQPIAVALALVLAAAYNSAAQPPPASTEIPAQPGRLEKIVASLSRERLTAAAAKPTAPAPTQAPKAQAGAKPGGILRIGGERDAGDLDPHTSRIGWDINIMQNVYSGLVRAGNDILPQPDLATRWEFKTPRRLEFTLRQGVKFHNTREVTAEDVKYSLERILDPKVPAAYASTIATIESIETPSKYLVVLNLKRPDAAIVANLSLASMAIVAKETVKPMPVGLKEEMMGSGPYMFKEHIKGQRLVLIKNPNYYEKGRPLLAEIHFIPLIDETARTNALRAGQVDFIEPVPPKDVNALRRDSKIVVTGGPNLSFVAVSLNTSKKPFDDVRVRRALAYAIDRKEMVEKAFDGFAQPLLGPPLIPPYWAGNKETYYELDRERAKRLLAEAGYPDGLKTTIRIGTTSYHAAFAAVVQSELKKIGIEVAIQASDQATANRAWIEGNFEMYPIRWWGSDFVDPDGAFTPLFTCKGTYNNSRFCDPELDKLLAKALEVNSIEDRKEAYRIAMKRLAEQQPWVFLVAFDRFQAMRSDVKGYTAYPNASQYSLREVWLSK
jgi:peptide/nickel transport system substrate-binding protein